VSTFVEQVRARLVGDNTILELLGVTNTRIYPQVAPQGTTAPYAVLTVVSDVPENSFTSEVDELLRNARLQVDCYAATYLGAHQVARAVDVVVAGLSGSDLSAVRESSRDLYDDEAQLHRVSMDFSVWGGE